MMQVLSGVWGGHVQSLQAGESQGGGRGEESGACLGGTWGSQGGRRVNPGSRRPGDFTQDERGPARAAEGPSQEGWL